MVLSIRRMVIALLLLLSIMSAYFEFISLSYLSRYDINKSDVEEVTTSQQNQNQYINDNEVIEVAKQIEPSLISVSDTNDDTQVQQYRSTIEVFPFSQTLSKSKRYLKEYIIGKNPAIADPGDDLLEFKEHLVHLSVRNTTRLEFELLFVQFVDDFGLIDLGWSDKEILEALQYVVDIWAQANIRMRIRKRESLQKVKLSRERSLGYLYYLNSPHLFSQLDARVMDQIKNGKTFGANNSLALAANGDEVSVKMTLERIEFQTLMEKEMGKELYNKITLLAKGDRTLIKNIRGGLYDWIIGWPAMLSPWRVHFGTTLFATHDYYFMNGGGTHGIVRHRTSSCDYGEKARFITFASNPSKRFRVRCWNFLGSTRDASNKADNPAIVRGWERKKFSPKDAGRLIAHEIGHSFGLKHVQQGGCKRYQKWQDAHLMMQVRSIAVEGAMLTKEANALAREEQENEDDFDDSGDKNDEISENGNESESTTETLLKSTSKDKPASCKVSGYVESYKAVLLTPEEIAQSRNYVMRKDISESPTVRNGIRVGQSINQIGSSTPELFVRGPSDLMKKSWLGRELKTCGYKMKVVIFTKLPAPTNGRIVRIRWRENLKGIGSSLPMKYRLLVVQQDQNIPNKFKIISKSHLFELPLQQQKMHPEVDLEGLDIEKGNLVALVSGSSNELFVEQRRYESDQTRHGETVQDPDKFARPVVIKLMSSIDKLAYPKILLSKPDPDAFYYIDKEVGENDEWISDAKQNVDCSELIFNYDMVNDDNM